MRVVNRIAIALFFSVFYIGHVAAMSIERIKTPAGIDAWFVHEPSIPVLSVTITWRDSGSAFEPLDATGTAQILGAMLSEGAGSYDQQGFQSHLDELAIDLGFGADRDDFRASLRTLSKNRDEAFRMLALALQSPRFDAASLERIRQRTLIRLSREQEEPGTIVSQRMMAQAFPDHPYGRNPLGNATTLGSISPDRLRQYMKAHIARDNLVIGVVGDITTEDLTHLLDTAFADLPAKAEPADPAHKDPILQKETIVIDRDIPQSQVRFLAPGIARDDPDFYAAFIMSYVFGGSGLTSRLSEEVREKRGLVYSIYSNLAPMRLSGVQFGGFNTENAKTAEALALVRQELARLRDHGITAAELAAAKTYLNGSFPLQLSTNSGIATMLVRMQLDHLGTDYVTNRARLINAVTLADIKRVATRLLDPNGMLVVIGGKPVGIKS